MAIIAVGLISGLNVKVFSGPSPPPSPPFDSVTAPASISIDVMLGTTAWEGGGNLSWTTSSSRKITVSATKIGSAGTILQLAASGATGGAAGQIISDVEIGGDLVTDITSDGSCDLIYTADATNIGAEVETDTYIITYTLTSQ